MSGQKTRVHAPTAVAADGCVSDATLRNLQARLDDVENTRESVEKPVAPVSDIHARETFRNAIERAVGDLEAVATDENAPADVRRLWSEEPIGSVTVSPPSAPAGVARDATVEWDTSARRVELVGLSDVHGTDTPLSVWFQGTERGPGMDDRRVAAPGTAELPWDVLDAAEAALRAAVGRLGGGGDDE